jgi:ATP-binding cassette subfamily B protein
MTRLVKYLKPYATYIAAALTLLFIQAQCDLALPDYMSNIINDGIMLGNVGEIIKYGTYMVAVALCSAAAAITSGLLASRIAAGFCRDLRLAIYQKVQTYSNAEFDRFATSSLITRTTNDITQLQMLIIMGIRMGVYAPLLGIGGVFHAYATCKSLTWIIILSVTVLICIIILVFIFAVPKFRIVQTLVDKLNLVVRENLDGMLVVRAFNTQSFEEKRFDKTNEELTKTNLIINLITSSMMPTMMLILNLSMVAVFWFGGLQVSSFNLDIGGIMAFMQYIVQILMAFLLLTVMFILVPRASVSGQRIAEVIESESSVQNRKITKKLGSVKGIVSFKDVSFSYSGAEENVLHNISFTAMPGQTTAFIGATGSGKSTIINLIPRFYDVTDGSITIDDEDIRDLELHNLRSYLGVVPQKANLFSGTIRSNILYGEVDASDDVLQKSTELAQASEFVLSKPEGYETPISQSGTNVSGGQKQRLAIARALSKRAPINIFDDCFSALDFKTDAALRKALKREMGKSTILIVAQRISTIMYADQIIVLEHGRIVGKGTHHQLMASCSVYQEIATSQLSKEELA